MSSNEEAGRRHKVVCNAEDVARVAKKLNLASITRRFAFDHAVEQSDVQ